MTCTHPRQMAQQNPQKPAVIEAKTGRVRSFGALEARANAIAHLCRNEGVQIGDCIAFLMEDRLECFDITWAAQRAGLYYLPVYTSIEPAEAADMIDHADAVLLFTSERYADLARDISQRCPKIRTVFVVGDTFDETLDALPATPIADETRGLPTQYTGGTTGKPKGLRTPLKGEPIETPDGLAALAVARFGFHEDMVFSTSAPLYHVAPVKLSMIAHALGATSILIGDFEAEWALQCIQTHAITHSHWVPHMFVHMVKLPATVRA
ncbi:MAG: AMP-binding protein, partial [Pseudomonadota bacterium]